MQRKKKYSIFSPVWLISPNVGIYVHFPGNEKHGKLSRGSRKLRPLPLGSFRKNWFTTRAGAVAFEAPVWLINITDATGLSLESATPSSPSHWRQCFIITNTMIQNGIEEFTRAGKSGWTSSGTVSFFFFVTPNLTFSFNLVNFVLSANSECCPTKPSAFCEKNFL